MTNPCIKRRCKEKEKKNQLSITKGESSVFPSKYEESCLTDLYIEHFYRYRCLKEAFVKAIGTGVEFRLDSLEFYPSRGADIFARVNGKELKEWKFWLHELGKRHMEIESEFPNFKFNVSHHGDYVAIASEPICIVGLDIVSHFLSWKETIPEFIQNFSSYFSRLEWDNIVKAGSDDDMLNEFNRYWCPKEAFVKAIGAGVGFRLDSLEFHQTRGDNIVARVDRKELKDWKFWLHELGKRHTVEDKQNKTKR